MSDVKASPNGARQSVLAPTAPLSGDGPGVPGAPGPAAPVVIAAPAEFRKPNRVPDYRLRGLQLDQPAVVEARKPAKKNTTRSRTSRSRAFRWLAAVFIALLAGTLVRISVVQSFYVPSVAMAPTIKAGDRLLVVKWSALSGPVKVGDIIVFRRPGTYNCTGSGAPTQDLVKRVVALPGQTIWSSGKEIYLDGTRLDEQGWFNHKYGAFGSLPVARTTVPRGDYFVMGDNRRTTCDSRSFGPVSRSLVVGKVVAIVFRGARPFIRFF
jgi:signal peptidase I